jgi:hypothetical protein
MTYKPTSAATSAASLRNTTPSIDFRGERHLRLKID